MSYQSSRHHYQTPPTLELVENELATRVEEHRSLQLFIFLVCLDILESTSFADFTSLNFL